MILKRNVLFIALFAIIMLFNYGSINAALGISPATTHVKFTPNLSFYVNYNVLMTKSDQKMSVFASGELTQYAHFDKQNLTAGEGFTAYVDLPDYIEKPGQSTLYINVLEEAADMAGVGARVGVASAIYIVVPYPGQYAEIRNFDISDANIGEPVNMVLNIDCLGNESIFGHAIVDILRDDELVEEIDFSERIIPNQTLSTFEKVLEQKYEAGTYNATVYFSYLSNGFQRTLNTSEVFRVGTLSVDIVNYTNFFNNSKISEFNIDIESKWNNLLPNVYAEVIVTNESGDTVDMFKTPSVNLYRFEKATLKGFFDSEGKKEGRYYVNITLYYPGGTTEKAGEIYIFNVKKESGLFNLPSFDLSSMNFLVIIVLILGLFVLITMIALIVIVFMLIRKNNVLLQTFYKKKQS